MMGWQQGWDGMMGGGWFMLWWIIVLIVLAVVVVRALSNSGGRGELPRSESPRAERETPLEIVQERYARGEISRDEYEEARRELQSP